MPAYEDATTHASAKGTALESAPATTGVSSMEKTSAEESAEETASFHDQVEKLVHETGNSITGTGLQKFFTTVMNYLPNLNRGQQLIQLFSAATEADIKTVAADTALVESLVEQTSKMGCKKCLDYLYKHMTNADILIKMIDVRFGVPVGSANAAKEDVTNVQSMIDGQKKKGKTEQSWTANGLIHVYSIYMVLPQSDLDLIRCLLTFSTTEYKGSGAARSADGVYFVNYSDDVSKGAYDSDNPITVADKFAPDDTYTRKTLVCIDMTTAHELGHIVDKHAPGGRPYSERFDSAGNAESGSIVEVSGWKRHYKSKGAKKLYKDIKKCIDKPYALSISGSISSDEKKVVNLAGEKILEGRHYKDADRQADILKAISESSITTEDEEELAEKIDKTAVIEHLVRAERDAAKSPQSQELFSNMPDRQIHEDYLTDDWYSYSNNARTGTKISTYQFRNPGEEFAETYASYHVADPKGSKTPDGLKTWFETAGLDKSDEVENG